MDIALENNNYLYTLYSLLHIYNYITITLYITIMILSCNSNI